MTYPTPIDYGAPGCPAMTRHIAGQFTSCPAEPTHAGYVGRPRIRVFPCAEHAALPQLADVAPMSFEDRAELDGRRVQHARALAGLRFERVGPAED